MDPYMKRRFGGNDTIGGDGFLSTRMCTIDKSKQVISSEKS